MRQPVLIETVRVPGAVLQRLPGTPIRLGTRYAMPGTDNSDGAARATWGVPLYGGAGRSGLCAYAALVLTGYAYSAAPAVLTGEYGATLCTCLCAQYTISVLT